MKFSRALVEHTKIETKIEHFVRVKRRREVRRKPLGDLGNSTVLKIPRESSEDEIEDLETGICRPRVHLFRAYITRSYRSDIFG